MSCMRLVTANDVQRCARGALGCVNMELEVTQARANLRVQLYYTFSRLT